MTRGVADAIRRRNPNEAEFAIRLPMRRNGRRCPIPAKRPGTPM